MGGDWSENFGSRSGLILPQGGTMSPQFDSSLENEMQANDLRARRNELLDDLAGIINPKQREAITQEIAEIGAAIDKLYLPEDEMKAEGYETPMQIRASLGL
jgi:hypothetical protein